MQLFHNMQVFKLREKYCIGRDKVNYNDDTMTL